MIVDTLNTRDTSETAGQSIGALVGGVVEDARLLVTQHVNLLKQEVREDIRKGKSVGFVMVASLVLAVVGGTCVAAMMVGLLAWAVPDLRWWAWSGIVGGAMLALAAGVFFTAKSKIATMNLIPDQSIRTIKEDLQWIKQQPPK